MGGGPAGLLGVQMRRLPKPIGLKCRKGQGSMRVVWSDGRETAMLSRLSRAYTQVRLLSQSSSTMIGEAEF